MNGVINKILGFFKHFLQRVLFFVYNLLLILIANIIFIITYEPGKRNIVTKRKIRRIRLLTRLKLYMWKYGKRFFVFIHNDEYLRDLNNRFGFLIK